LPNGGSVVEHNHIQNGEVGHKFIVELLIPDLTGFEEAQLQTMGSEILVAVELPPAYGVQAGVGAQTG